MLYADDIVKIILYLSICILNNKKYIWMKWKIKIKINKYF